MRPTISRSLLRDWNWYLPNWLDWLPKFESGEPMRREPDLEPALQSE